jgi:acyl-CoA thioesterase YciA
MSEPYNSPDQDQPKGTLTLQTLSMPANTNPHGDIFGGWLLSQMDIAGAVLALEVAQGKVTTVAVSGMTFLRPVPVGNLVSCYALLKNIGTTSITVAVEVWIKDFINHTTMKVTEGNFVYVAVDDRGEKRKVIKEL